MNNGLKPTQQECTISDKAIRCIKGNNRLIGRLMIAFNRSQNTIENWMAAKDVRLTTPIAVKIIEQETSLTEEQILVRNPNLS